MKVEKIIKFLDILFIGFIFTEVISFGGNSSFFYISSIEPNPSKVVYYFSSFCHAVSSVFVLSLFEISISYFFLRLYFYMKKSAINLQYIFFLKNFFLLISNLLLIHIIFSALNVLVYPKGSFLDVLLSNIAAPIIIIPISLFFIFEIYVFCIKKWLSLKDNSRDHSLLQKNVISSPLDQVSTNNNYQKKENYDEFSRPELSVHSSDNEKSSDILQGDISWEEKKEIDPNDDISPFSSQSNLETSFEENEDQKNSKIFSILSTLDNESLAKVNGKNEVAEKYFLEIKNKLEEKISEFKISGRITNVLKGPVVDTFEFELGAGVKVSKVVGIAEDLSLALSGAPIRMVYPLKGKTTLGIEVPRSPREIIYLTDILKTQFFENSQLKIPIVMGKDAFGIPFVQDLATMPHMLVAGSTGAGKSVFINSLLVSLLVKLSAKKLKLILIDPKQLELALYSKVKHLALPVITTPGMTSAALLWACEEMERRYELMGRFGVRNLEGYSRKIIEDNKLKGSEELPYIVIIIDEFADLILSKNGKDIETNVCRLAAKARAAGIHLVIATQRPSVDVITGLIKSNFPTRVSFRVTSSIDSRTILNAMGAEKLLGMGDMLFKAGVEMIRVHSSYISENDIEEIVKIVSTDNPIYDDEALNFLEENADESGNHEYRENNVIGGAEKDPLYSDATQIVMEYKSASASMLQRRLKIGYNRAANLVEQMEKDGLVGPQQGAKPRKILSNSTDQSYLR